jgi:hypothetical protein
MKRARSGAENLILLAEVAEHRRDLSRYLVLGSRHHCCRGRRGGCRTLGQCRTNARQLLDADSICSVITLRNQISSYRRTHYGRYHDGNQGTLTLMKRRSSRVKTCISRKMARVTAPMRAATRTRNYGDFRCAIPRRAARRRAAPRHRAPRWRRLRSTSDPARGTAMQKSAICDPRRSAAP